MFATEHRVTGGCQFLADYACGTHISRNDFFCL